MAFSPEFKIAITKEVFANDDGAGLHDTIYEACDESLSIDELKFLFEQIPEELQILALLWSLSDTQFRDDVYREVVKYKKAYLFDLKKFRKAK